MSKTFLLLLALLGLALPISPAQETAAAPAGTKTAIFAGGCFWCIQTPFDKAKGVVKTIVGYTGGSAEDAPTKKSPRITPSIGRRSKSLTIRHRFRTISSSTFSGATSTQPRPTDN